MTFSLSNLQNTSRPAKDRKRVGRGTSSGWGKTSGRGHKGAGSRSGYKRRYGFEGGGLPLYKKLPTKGFNNISFAKKYHTINLQQIGVLFADGESVNIETLKQKGFLNGRIQALKILGNGVLSKNVKIEAQAYSKSAIDQLNKKNITFKITK